MENISNSTEKPDFEAKVNFYREQTVKLREYLEVNKIGRANQNIFEALYDHINYLNTMILDQKEALVRSHRINGVIRNKITALQKEIQQLKN